MIKHWFITGDTHRQIMNRFNQIPYKYEPTETALIILGDAGINFYLNKTDKNLKKAIELTGYTVYCLHGNHEERPQYLGYPIVHDKEVAGNVYCEAEFPHIKYLIDGNVYWFGDYRTLAIGGAYSVDKWYRLSKAELSSYDSHEDKAHYAGWFDNEQVDIPTRYSILEKLKGMSFDLVLTHTCPYDWMPIELFLSGLDQSTVDNSTEVWLNLIADTIHWNKWVFGHFHDDMLIRPNIAMLYKEVLPLEEIMKSALDFKKSKDYYSDN